MIINDLPEEILLHVFHLGCDQFTFDKIEARRLAQSRLKAAKVDTAKLGVVKLHHLNDYCLAPSAVCKAWRSVICRDTSLWIIAINMTATDKEFADSFSFTDILEKSPHCSLEMNMQSGVQYHRNHENITFRHCLLHSLEKENFSGRLRTLNAQLRNWDNGIKLLRSLASLSLPRLQYVGLYLSWLPPSNPDELLPTEDGQTQTATVCLPGLSYLSLVLPTPVPWMYDIVVRSLRILSLEFSDPFGRATLPTTIQVVTMLQQCPLLEVLNLMACGAFINVPDSETPLLNHGVTLQHLHKCVIEWPLLHMTSILGRLTCPMLRFLRIDLFIGFRPRHEVRMLTAGGMSFPILQTLIITQNRIGLGWAHYLADSYLPSLENLSIEETDGTGSSIPETLRPKSISLPSLATLDLRLGTHQFKMIYEAVSSCGSARQTLQTVTLSTPSTSEVLRMSEIQMCTLFSNVTTASIEFKTLDDDGDCLRGQYGAMEQLQTLKLMLAEVWQVAFLHQIFSPQSGIAIEDSVIFPSLRKLVLIISDPHPRFSRLHLPSQITSDIFERTVECFEQRQRRGAGLEKFVTNSFCPEELRERLIAAVGSVEEDVHMIWFEEARDVTVPDFSSSKPTRFLFDDRLIEI